MTTIATLIHNFTEQYPLSLCGPAYPVILLHVLSNRVINNALKQLILQFDMNRMTEFDATRGLLLKLLQVPEGLRTFDFDMDQVMSDYIWR